MGVSGLNPFLQKVCPQVFKSIPNRFQELSGKRVVLDATLITQRLHFAQVPHPHRHVLGWYRIIQELKESSVTAVCIFDGKGRNAAKQREVERRREARRILASRGSLEKQRLTRLQRLLPPVQAFQSLTDEAQTVVLGELRAATEEGSPPLPSTSLLVNEGEIDPAVEPRIDPQEAFSATPLVSPSIDGTETTTPPSIFPVDSSAPSPVTPDSTREHGTDTQESSPVTPPVSPPANETEPVVPSSFAFAEPSTPSATNEANPDATGKPPTNSGAAFPALPHLAAEVTPTMPPRIDETKIPSTGDTQLASGKISSAEPTIPSPVSEQKQAERGGLSTGSQEVPPNISPSPPSALQESLAVSSEDSKPYTSYHTEIPYHEYVKIYGNFYEGVGPDGYIPTLSRERDVGSLEGPSESVDTDEGASSLADQSSLLSIDDIRSSLTNLYTEFKESSGELASIRYEDVSPPSLLNDESVDSQVCSTASKAQLVLTNAEEDFWKHLRGRDSASHSTLEAAAFSLLQQSSMLSESYERRTQPPTAANYEECKEILRAMGVPCIDVDGPYEAEAVAASIVMQGQADYVASEDTDVLVYGAPLVRNISVKAEPLVVVSGTDVWDNLKLNQTQFIDFALLLGTDFCERIKMIGPMRALKFIREYGSIERIIESETRYSPPRSTLSYLEQVSIARLVFSTLPPVPTEDLTPLPSDELAIQAIMHKYRLWNALSDEHPWATGLSLEGNYFEEGPTIS